MEPRSAGDDNNMGGAPSAPPRRWSDHPAPGRGLTPGHPAQRREVRGLVPSPVAPPPRLGSHDWATGPADVPVSHLIRSRCVGVVDASLTSEGVGMSLLEQIEKQLIGRLKELEPLRREYERLRKAAEHIGIKYSPGASEQPAAPQPSSTRASSSERAGGTSGARAPKTATTSARTRSRPSERGRKARPQARASRPTSVARGSRGAGGASRRSGRRRAPSARPGQRQEEVLRLVAERPGITVREIAAQLGVDATGLYRVVNGLTADGRIRKDGTGLHPIEPAAAPTAGAADVSATGPERADTGASDAAAAAERSGSTDGVTAEAAAAPEADGAETPAESAPANQ
jgi:hypothetical protein